MGEKINSRLVCLRLQEFVVVAVECILVCVFFSVFLPFCRRQDENPEVYPTLPGEQSSHFPLIFQPFCPLLQFLISECSLSVINLCPSALYPFLSSLSLCYSPHLSGGSISNGISSADQPEAGSQAKCTSSAGSSCEWMCIYAGNPQTRTCK